MAKRGRPALTPEARENQMIALAVDLAEQRLRDGTASSQLITHYVKLASPTVALEREILVKNKELLEAKTQSLQSAKQTGEAVAEVLAAFKKYSGYSGDDDDD